MNDNRYEFGELLDRHFDDALTPEEGACFAKLLSADPANVHVYVEASILHQQARSILKFERTVGNPIAPFNENSLSPSTTQWGWITSSVLFLLLFGVIVAWVASRNGSNQFNLPTDWKGIANHGEKVPSSKSAAILVSATGKSLENVSTNTIWNIGDKIGAGDEITLREGIADFRLADSGVAFSVEGPATFIMTSSDSLLLQQGKFTVRVPRKDEKFQLMAGPYRLHASDAEFGTQVQANSVYVHSFSGEVTTTSSPFYEEDEKLNEGPDDDQLAEPKLLPIVIAQSKAVKLTTGLEGDISIQHFAADQNEFASKISMAGRLPITSKYVEAVKRSKPVGYWRFEQIDTEEVKNEIPRGCSIKAVGVSLVGDELNRVLNLDGKPIAKDNLISSRTIDAFSKGNYTVEFWAKPSHSHRGCMVTAMDMKNDKSAFYLETKVGRSLLRYVQRFPFDKLRYFSSVSTKPYKVRRWQHVVIVKQKPSLLIYLDGRLASDGKDNETLPRGLNLVVGHKYEYPFVGQLDELSVYDRALTKQEVNDHYKSVQQAEKPNSEI